MSILLICVLAYLLISVGIGIYASMKVKTTTDYVLAGRGLPMYVTIATVFATWFGAEAIQGVPGKFASAEGNLREVIADPFGAGLCLVFVGLFFALPLYRMKLYTIADFYRQKYNRNVELLISLFICVSYLGWVAAQVSALGTVLNVVSGGSISMTWGMAIGLAAVMGYTVMGGMLAVAVTDFIQMVVIIVGTLIAAWLIMGQVDGGTSAVIQHASELGKFDFFPVADESGSLFWPWIAFFGSFITLAFGSIPQQDVFQRVMSAKDEKTAVWGTVIGGSFYIIFCFVPMFIAVAATMINADLLHMEDIDAILPTVFLKDFFPIWVQVLFFGALLSALMSTASGTLLAPSAIVAENVLKEFLNLDEKSLLFTLRLCVFTFGLIVFGYAYLGEVLGLSVFEMVENAYLITLCGAFVPLAAGVYWKRANLIGCYFSIALGVGSWIILEIINITVYNWEMKFPPHVAGFFLAILGMVIGSLAFGKTTEELQKEAAAATATA